MKCAKCNSSNEAMFVLPDDYTIFCESCITNTITDSTKNENTVGLGDILSQYIFQSEVDLILDIIKSCKRKKVETANCTFTFEFYSVTINKEHTNRMQINISLISDTLLLKTKYKVVKTEIGEVTEIVEKNNDIIIVITGE